MEREKGNEAEWISITITGRMKLHWKQMKERILIMSKLYELAGEYLTLLEMMESGEYDEQTIRDTLEGVQGEIEVKADSYAKIIRMLNGEVDMFKAEEERLAARRKSLENHIDSMKRNLEKCMIATDNRKFKTDLFSFAIQKNAPSIVYDDRSKVPAEYLIPQEPKVDTAALKNALKEQDMPCAHLVQSESIRIR